jgi:hypothetical protein
MHTGQFVFGKNTFSVFNLGLKYPNIAARLRSYSITEFNIIKRTNTEKVIIIGEKMEERVLPATNDVFKRITQNSKINAEKSVDKNKLRNEGKKQLLKNLNEIFVLAKALHYEVVDDTQTLDLSKL